MLRAHLIPVLIGERAYALADAMRARRECILALLDLLDDLLPPVGGVGASGDGRFSAGPTDGERCDRKTDSALGGYHGCRLDKSLEKNRHVSTSLEIGGVVLGLHGHWARAALSDSLVPELLLQPALEIAAFHAHPSSRLCMAPKYPFLALI
jgi:hypothetical protein